MDKVERKTKFLNAERKKSRAPGLNSRQKTNKAKREAYKAIKRSNNKAIGETE